MKKPAMLLFALITLVIVGLAFAPAGESQAQAPALELLGVLTLSGDPERIMPLCYGKNCRRLNDLIYYDNAGNTLRFLDLNTLELTEFEIKLSHFSTDFFMVKNHYNNLIYALTENKVCNNRDLKIDCWDRALVNIIAGRNYAGNFPLNEEFDGDPPNPNLTPRYDIDGVTFKEPMAEGNEGGRLFVHDVIKRNVDIVDISPYGTGDVAHYRYSYLEPVACYDQTTCHWRSPLGNSLALEYEHETLAKDDLAAEDDLYIENGPIFVMRHNQGVGPLEPTALPKVDFKDTFPFGNGTSTLGVGTKDRLYAPSGSQSFEEGYIGLVSTTNNTLNDVLSLTYRDQGHMVIDHFDKNRVFVLTNDGFRDFDPENKLTLNLIYDDVIIGQLPLMKDYDGTSLNDMVFDAASRQLFVLVGNKVHVVQVNHGAEAPPTQLTRFAFQVQAGKFFQNFDAPDDSVSFTFSSTSVLTDTTVMVHERAAVNESFLAPVQASSLREVRLFEIAAEETANGTPLTEFITANQSIIVRYTDREVAGVKEETLRLYFRSGGQWILMRSPGPDLTDNELTVSFQKTGLYGLFGNSELIFLPALSN